jgi:hypothetical protein
VVVVHVREQRADQFVGEHPLVEQAGQPLQGRRAAGPLVQRRHRRAGTHDGGALVVPYLLDVAHVGPHRGEEPGEEIAATESLQVVLGGGPADPQDVAGRLVDTAAELVVHALRCPVEHLRRPAVVGQEIGSADFGDPVADVLDDHGCPQVDRRRRYPRRRERRGRGAAGRR